jgi:holo-[acyl-carrier protein] synthase
MDSARIVQTIARLTRKKPEQVQDHLSLGTLGISASLGLGALRSLIESGTALKLPAFTLDTTVSQLCQLANGEGTSVPMTIAAVQVSPSSPIQRRTKSRDHIAEPMTPASPILSFGIGLDMQEVSVLPDAGDLRADPFYAGHFVPSELATAVLRQDPRAHLCGIFCAKEAAKKSHAALLDIRMDELVIVHDAIGRPSLRPLDAELARRFTFTISITHTDRFAAATCLTTERMQ